MPGQRGTVRAGPAHERSIELRPLVQPVQAGLPGEAEAAVRLDGAGRDLKAAFGRRGGRERGGLRQQCGVGVGGPCRLVRRGTGAFCVQQHVRQS